MNTLSKSVILALSIGLGLSACDKNEQAAQSDKAFVSTVAAEQNSGKVNMLLPDFAQLVAQEGSTVVNIHAVREASEHHELSDSSQNDAFEDFLRRLLPDGQNDTDDPGRSFGSGVIISTDGYVMTNAHVIDGMNSIKVTLNDKREYQAEVVGSDERSDIALLKISAKDLPAAKIGSSDKLKSGEWVAAIGAPFGFESSVTAGIVSAKGRSLPNDSYIPFIQTDVAINPGNSGGPLFNLNGEVVGINSQIYSRSGGFMGISFAIPIEVAVNVAEQLKATGTVKRGQLGIVIQEVSYNLAQSFGLDSATGALVSQISPNGPAAKAGLQVGDIIRGVDGQEVRSSAALPVMIGSLPPGKQVKLDIWRKGKIEQIAVTLGTLGENAPKAEPRAQSSDNEAQAENRFAIPKIALSGSIENLGGRTYFLVDSAAGASYEGGLRSGDMVVEIAHQPVQSRAQVESLLSQSGAIVPVLVQRNGQAGYFAIRLP